MDPKHPGKVTLEDLLRAKRAERPPAEFWTRFEEELRAKQLAALVQQRPWWVGVGERVRGTLVRYGLPLGATAALAVIGWVYQAGPVAPVVAQTSPTAPNKTLNLASTGPVRATMTQTVPAPVTVAAVSSPASSATKAVAVLQPATSPGAANRRVAVTTEHPMDSVPPTPWTTSISDSTGPALLAQNGSLNLGDVTSAATVPPVTTAPAEATTPLAAVDSPRSRLLGLPIRPEQIQVASAEAQALEQVSHRLNEELLHTATRHIVGMDGGTVTVRF